MPFESMKFEDLREQFISNNSGEIERIIKIIDEALEEAIIKDGPYGTFIVRDAARDLKYGIREYLIEQYRDNDWDLKFVETQVKGLLIAEIKRI